MSAAAAFSAPADKRRRTLTTPEGLTLPLTLASRSARAGALILDVMIILFALIALHIAVIAAAGGLLEDPQLSGASEFLQIVLILALFVGWYGYFLVQELSPRGATLGKRLLGIRIAARGGEGRLTPEAVIARNLLRDIEIVYPLAFIIGSGAGALNGEDGGGWLWAAAGWFALFALMPLFNRDALRAGDIIAGTWVVEAPRVALAEALSARAAADEAAPAAPLAPFTRAELSVYGIRELQVLENLLREGEAPALETVQRTIAAKLGREAQPGEARAFLEAFYAALRARLEQDMRLGKRKADKHS